MAVLGVEMKQEQLRYCVLDGTRRAPNFLKHDSRSFRLPMGATDMMDFMRHTFEELIDQWRPIRIGYRVAMSNGKAIKKIDQYSYLYFSYGILNLVAHDRQLPTKLFLTSSFSSKFFGEKGERAELCDRILGRHPPNWDEAARMAALAALGVLK